MTDSGASTPAGGAALTGDGAAAVAPGLPATGDRRLLCTVLLPLVSATTWLAVIHLLAGFVIGVVVLPLVLVGLILGCALLPTLPAGVAVLASTFWLCGLLARGERARFELLLGRQIRSGWMPPADTWWRAIVRNFMSAATWRYLAYALLRLPLSLLEVVLVLTVWGQGLALAAIPAYVWAAPGGVHVDGMAVHGFWLLAVATVTGVALLLAAPHVTRGLATMDAAVGGLLLQTDRRAELTARIGELETTRAQVVDAAAAERMRIERDLHDGAQQRLVSLAMELGRAKAKFSSDPAAAAIIVSEAHEQAKQALSELRHLVRGVHPPVLTARGLDAALSSLAALCPVPVTVRVDLPVIRPPSAIEAIAYFVVAEALTNVAKHAHASHAEVVVKGDPGLLTLVVSDDGVGGADQSGQGLSGLAARVAGVDGRLKVTSPQGGPTVIEVALPCGS